MATNKELEKQIAQLTALLAAHGIGTQAQARGDIPLEERQDYIPFGSDKHLTFLGLAKVGDVEEAQKNRYTVYASASGTSYRLLDELGAALMMRPLDPDKGILLVLRQKISSFESGRPEPFPGAPTRFIPPGDPEYTRIA